MPESALQAFFGRHPGRMGQRRDAMDGPNHPKPELPGPRHFNATRRSALGLLLGAPLLSACAGVQQSLSQFSNPFSGSEQPGPAGPAQQPVAVGNGQVKVGLILPLSASGNAGVAAQSMKNAAEMALAEFQNPNVQLLVKDDGGTHEVTTVGGCKLWLKSDGKGLTVTDEAGGTAHVTIADVKQSNGVIHVVDAVLLPKM